MVERKDLEKAYSVIDDILLRPCELDEFLYEFDRVQEYYAELADEIRVIDDYDEDYPCAFVFATFR